MKLHRCQEVTEHDCRAAVRTLAAVRGHFRSTRKLEVKSQAYAIELFMERLTNASHTELGTVLRARLTKQSAEANKRFYRMPESDFRWCYR